MPHYSLASGSLGCLLGLCWPRGLGVIVFLWCVPRVENYCLKVFCLATLVFWLQKAGFHWGFILFVGVSRLLASLALDYLRHKENPGNLPQCHSLGSAVASLSFPLSLPSYICFTDNVQGFSISQRNGRKNLSSVFPEVKVSSLC